MTVWYVHRRDDGTIASAHQERQEGYADEGLDAQSDTGLAAFLAQAQNPVPIVVTAEQAIRALYTQGLLESVTSAVETAGGLTKALWQHASDFHRKDPIMIAMGEQMGMTDQQMDDLFRFAATL